MKINYLFLCFALLLIVSSAVAWDFPSIEKLKESGHNSPSEIRIGLQIPPETLRVMSTEELIDVCLRHPYFGAIYFFDNVLFSLTGMIDGFNGLTELMNRNDAFGLLYSKFKLLGPENFKAGWSPSEKGHYIFQENYVKMLMALFIRNKSFSVDLETKNQILTDLVNRFNRQIQEPGEYGITTTSSAAFLAAQFLIASSNAQFEQKCQEQEMKMFLDSGLAYDFNITLEIMEMAEKTIF